MEKWVGSHRGLAWLLLFELLIGPAPLVQVAKSRAAESSKAGKGDAAAGAWDDESPFNPAAMQTRAKRVHIIATSPGILVDLCVSCVVTRVFHEKLMSIFSSGSLAQDATPGKLAGRKWTYPFVFQHVVEMLHILGQLLSVGASCPAGAWGILVEHSRQGLDLHWVAVARSSSLQAWAHTFIRFQCWWIAFPF